MSKLRTTKMTGLAKHLSRFTLNSICHKYERGIGLLLLTGLIFLFQWFVQVDRSFAQSRDTVAWAGRAPIINLNDGVAFEVSPHTGLMGKSGAFGLRLSMNYGSFNLELAGEQVLGKFANLYPLSVNGILNLSTRSRLIPYGVVGVGLLLTVPTATIGDETVSSIGMNFGAGARYYFTKSFGIRAEVKQYVTNVKNARNEDDELMLFQEVTLGVTFMIR
jgi:opacity protein-like surface antigen